MTTFSYKEKLAVLLTFICSMSFILSSCTKEEITPYPQESQSRILSYHIINTNEKISGVVDDTDHTITVYLPPNTALTLLEPQIRVSEGATVTPVSGTYIEDLLDYFASGREIKYTVTGKDKSSNTYTLKIISLQPQLSFKEVSTDASSPLTFNHSLSWQGNSFILEADPEYTFSVPAAAKVSLIAANGTVYPFTTIGLLNNRITVQLQYIQGYAYDKTDSPPAGDYHIRVQYYSRIVTLKNPISIVYQ